MTEINPAKICGEKELFRFLIARVAVLTLILLLFQSFWAPDILFSRDGAQFIDRGDKLFSVSFSDEWTGFAAGNNGLLLRTANGGETWEKVDTESSASLNRIAFVGKNGWIVGGNGLVLHSRDGGKDWSKQDTDFEFAFIGVYFLNSTEGFAVGESGAIYQTDDGGESWTMVPIDWMSIVPEHAQDLGALPPNLHDLTFFDEAQGLIIGEKGVILRTNDRGETWELTSVGRYPSLYSLCFKNEREGFIAGQDGLLLYTRDGGETWQQVAIPEDVAELDLYKVRIQDSQGLVVGDRGTILQSRDGGDTWEQEKLDLRPPLPWFLDAYFVPENSPAHIVVVGKGTLERLEMK